MTTLAELEELLAVGHETRSFEVKGPGALAEKPFVARVARAAMALGNLRDGGVLCIGINDTTISEMRPGLTDSQFAGWSDYDNVSDALSRYSDPPVAFTIRPHTLGSKTKVVVLDVAEFEHSPHICARDYPEVLQKGMIYVRPRGKPQSVPVPSVPTMRELLDLAITRSVSEFVGRGVAAGLFQPVDSSQGDSTPFDAEADLAWENGSVTLNEVASAAHFDIAIQPGPYRTDRIPNERLEQFIAQNTVRLRGWPVPYVSRDPVERHGRWVGQDYEPSQVFHREAWRLCTSGQFLQRRVLANELHSTAETSPTAPEATGAVVVPDMLFYLVEVAVLAARIAGATEAATVTIDVALNNIAGRQLVSGTWKRELDGVYLFAGNTMRATASAATTEIITRPRLMGVQLVQQLLHQFGVDVPDQVLDDWQEDVLSDSFG